MNPDKQDARRRQIEQAAYDLLRENGYRSTSMLAVAKRAGASNETLYRWYGTKQALFAALVQENARTVRERLDQVIAADEDPMAALHSIAPLLLGLVTSERAVLLNRAAAGDVDDTGVLGRTIAACGREAVLPRLADVLGKARQAGALGFAPAQAAQVAATFINLLIGDLQIQRVIGVRPELSPQEIKARSSDALDKLTTLYPPAGSLISPPRRARSARSGTPS
ncbi:MAG: TetR/AcrR family transcriptional regulator [Burkholderiaceae bacterium]